MVGKLPGTTSVYEIGFDSVIQSADELISPPAVAEFVSPGFIDIQVNGFAGVDYNDPDASLDQIAALLAHHVFNRCDALLPDHHHGIG